MNRSMAGGAVAALALVAALAGCGSNAPAATTGSTPQTGPGRVSTTGGGNAATTPSADAVAVDTVVAASLHTPIAMATKPDDPGHLWVAERAGHVRRLSVQDDGDTLTPDGEPVLDISDQVSTESERGLLGIAFSRDGTTLFASFTNTEGNSRVMAYPVDGTTVDEAAGRQIFATDQPYPNHNGGNIAIGPDGELWLGLGDGGAADDPDNHAQDPTSPLGKMLRIDPKTAKAEVVVTGVRNPWRWAFDTDGSLWIADVGQNRYEEIDHLDADAIDGANLGWSAYEATHRNTEGSAKPPADAIAPVFEYSHDGGNCSITGGFVYRGSAIDGLRGAFLFADYCAGRIRAIKLHADGSFDRELDLGVQIDNPISFGRDQQGEPYVLSEGGNVVRLIPGR